AVEQPLQGVHRAHLIGDRADAADPGGDVRSLARMTSAQQGIEKARRLEQDEAQVRHPIALDDEMERATTLDTRERSDVDDLTPCPGRRHYRSRATDARTR